MSTCCCSYDEERNTIRRCLPRAMDMGHCFEAENGFVSGDPIPDYCCKAETP